MSEAENYCNTDSEDYRVGMETGALHERVRIVKLLRGFTSEVTTYRGHSIRCIYEVDEAIKEILNPAPRAPEKDEDKV